MQYESKTEKIPMTPLLASRPVNNQDFKQNGDIKRARRIVLIVLGIKLFVALIYLVLAIISLIRNNHRIDAQGNMQSGGFHLGSTIFGAVIIVYLIIFTIVVARYLRVGILICAWLAILELILNLIAVVGAIIVIVLASFAAVAVRKETNGTASKVVVGTGLAVSIVFVVITTIAFLFTILMVIFSFKLAKLIKQQKAYNFV